jgi:hypothetical protein
MSTGCRIGGEDVKTCSRGCCGEEADDECGAPVGVADFGAASASAASFCMMRDGDEDDEEAADETRPCVLGGNKMA